MEWPIEYAGQTIRDITLRRLNGHDFQQLVRMQSEEGAGAALLRLMTDLPDNVIAQLDADDFVTVNEAAVAFLPRRLQEEMSRQTFETGGK